MSGGELPQNPPTPSDPYNTAGNFDTFFSMLSTLLIDFVNFKSKTHFEISKPMFIEMRSDLRRIRGISSKNVRN